VTLRSRKPRPPLTKSIITPPAETDEYPNASAYPFDYTAAPKFSDVSPASGPPAGGETVMITGSGLMTATAVYFGTAPAAIVQGSISATSLMAVAPAGVSGPVDVTGFAVGGTSATSMADLFTYAAPKAVAPTITSISPPSGPLTGRTSVTIMASDLANAGLIEFGPTPVTDVLSDSADEIVVVSPAGWNRGPVNANVTTMGGTSGTSPADSFFYFSNAATAPSPCLG
jgi:IPT/TIG domain